MPQDRKNDNLLSSWKEISEFLKCDVKTCRRWEQTAGLPVHRVSDVSKSRVFAYRDEVDAWVKKRAANGAAAVRPPGAGKKRSGSSWPRLRLGLGAAGLGLACLWAFVLRPGVRPSFPADFRIERSALVVLDAKGRELWRHDTKLENLLDNNFYLSSFQVKKPNPDSRSRILPHLIIRDLDNDGKPEVLFAPLTQDEMNSGLLLCFDYRGAELWRFQSGREMKFGSKTYGRDYMIHGFDAADLGGDGELEIMVIGYQRPDWPTQLALLDAGGRLIGEYWNSGQFNDYLFTDLDGDGRTEIILAGLNNEYAKGCLVVLSADRVEGGSPQLKEEFTCADLNRGSERYYILFPATDVEETQGIFESVGRINLMSGGKLQALMLHSGIFYYLDSRLAVTDHIISHVFMGLHRQAVQDGLVTSVLDDGYRRALVGRFLYFDGREWTPNVTPVRREPGSGR